MCKIPRQGGLSLSLAREKTASPRLLIDYAIIRISLSRRIGCLP